MGAALPGPSLTSSGAKFSQPPALAHCTTWWSLGKPPFITKPEAASAIRPEAAGLGSFSTSYTGPEAGSRLSSLSLDIARLWY
jgi:hypothetical protein